MATTGNRMSINTLRVHKSNKRFFLTVSFGTVFQTESDGEHGIIFKEFCGEGIPPEIVTVLKAEEETLLGFLN